VPSGVTGVGHGAVAPGTGVRRRGGPGGGNEAALPPRRDCWAGSLILLN